MQLRELYMQLLCLTSVISAWALSSGWHCVSVEYMRPLNGDDKGSRATSTGKSGLVARPNCSWKSTSQVVVLSTTSSCRTQMLCCRVCTTNLATHL